MRTCDEDSLRLPAAWLGVRMESGNCQGERDRGTPLDNTPPWIDKLRTVPLERYPPIERLQSYSISKHNPTQGDPALHAASHAIAQHENQ